jgi:hypothetical protein
VAAHETPVEPDFDVGQVRGDLNEPADHGRVDVGVPPLAGK